MDTIRCSRLGYEVRRRASTGFYGVWDMQAEEWAVRPVHRRLEAGDMLNDMSRAYDDGYADAVMATVCAFAGRRSTAK